MRERLSRKISLRTILICGLALSAALAGIVSTWASSHPDGLEFVAEKLGFLDTAGPHNSDNSPLAGYAIRGMEGSASAGLAGVVGVLVVALLAFGLMRLLRRRPSTTD